MSLCRCLQKATRSQLAVIRPPVFISRTRQARALSTFPLASFSYRKTHFQHEFTPTYRNFSWSSKPVTPESLAAAPPPPPAENRIESPEKIAPDPSVKTAPAPETIPPTKPDEVLTEDSISTVTSPESDSLFVEAFSNSNPPPPLQLGDLSDLGFSNFTPVGAAQAALEFVQVMTGLPWWGTIILTTVLIRLALVKLAINSMRSAAAMARVRPQVEKLMAEIKDATAANDQLRKQAAILDVRQLHKANGTGPLSVITGPVTQALTSISMFIGIKKLCDFPLAQLKYEGLAWIPSFSAADPYYILPVASVGLMNLQIYLGRADMAASGSKALHFSNFFRVLSIVSLAFLSYLPSGLLLYLVTNTTLVAIQGIALRQPPLRKSLNIPPLIRPKPEEIPTMKDTWQATKEWFRERNQQAVTMAERRSRVPKFPAQSTMVPKRGLSQRSGKHKF